MRWNHIFALLRTAGLAVVASSCSSDASGPAPVRTASATAVADGNDQVGPAGSQLVNPIAVKVFDQTGAPMPGATVGFTVVSGGGAVSASAVSTDSTGVAKTTWFLGAGLAPGNQAVAASVAGATGSPVTFTARVITRVVKLGGDAQSGEVLQAVPEVPAVSIRDAADNPVPGFSVTWTVTGGGGWVATSASLTDASGVASMPWTLGPTVGTDVHSLTASLSPSVATSFTASAVLTGGIVIPVGAQTFTGFTDEVLWITPAVAVKTPGPSGVPVTGVAVSWQVTAGGGTVQEITATEANGVALTAWTLGGAVGVNVQGLQASVAGLDGSPVLFTASATHAPASVLPYSGNLQTGVVGELLLQPLVVQVLDAGGAPLEGVPVYWELPYDTWWTGGAVTPSHDTTDVNGRAEAWLTLIDWVGSHLVFAYVSGACHSEPCTPLAATFTANGIPGPPAALYLASGNSQTAPVGTALPMPIAVYVRDISGNPISGVTVQWAAGPGSGSTTSASSTTDASGLASTGWTIGTTVGINNQTATATVAGLSGSPVTFVASATAGP